jgi:hypothetical protein
MHTDHARALMRRMQLVAGVVGAGAVAAAVVPVKAPEYEPVAKPAPAKASAESGVPVELDLAQLTSALELVAPPVQVKPPAPVAAKPADEPPPPPPKPVWRYLGGLLTPDIKRAIVVVKDKQRLLKVGDKVDEGELTAIEDSHIMVRIDGENTRFDLAPRQAGALKVMNAGQMAAMQARNQAQNIAALQQQQGGLTAQQIAVREAHAKRMAKQGGRFDDAMARQERIDQLLKSGAINDDQANEARRMIEKGMGSEEINSFMGVKGSDGIDGGVQQNEREGGKEP